MSEAYIYKTGEVEAEKFFWELFNSEKWDYLFNQKVLPRNIPIVPSRRSWFDISGRSTKEQIQVIYSDESLSSSVTIGMKKVTSGRVSTWCPDSVTFDICIIVKNKAGREEKDIISATVCNICKINT